MSLLKYFTIERKSGKPNQDDNDDIHDIQELFEKLAADASVVGRKRGEKNKSYEPEEGFKIAEYASENGNAAAVRRFGAQ